MRTLRWHCLTEENITSNKKSRNTFSYLDFFLTCKFCVFMYFVLGKTIGICMYLLTIRAASCQDSSCETFNSLIDKVQSYLGEDDINSFSPGTKALK